jgi:hydroxymethylpyrimidine pyrophosphatase-like HAD family hydrolase
MINGRGYDRYIFTDIDGCLIDGNSQRDNLKRFTVPVAEVGAAIRALNKEGIGFGLNSSRNIRGMAEIAMLIGEDCAAIGEYGSFVGWYHNNAIEITEEIGTRIVLPEGLKKATPLEMKRGISDKGLYAEAGREYTACVYCMREGQPNPGLAQEMEEILIRLNPDHRVFTTEKGRVWCLPKRSDKGIGLKRFGEINQCVLGMIGHDDYDVEALLVSRLAMAPSNAEIGSWGKNWDYVSGLPYTAGVIDCLAWAGKGRNNWRGAPENATED